MRARLLWFVKSSWCNEMKSTRSLTIANPDTLQFQVNNSGVLVDVVCNV